MQFINSQEGLVFGDSSISGTFIAGTILKTTDGGQTWNTYTLSNPSYRITKAFMLNSNEVFAAGRSGGGNNGLFLKSTDGGVTWGTDAFFNERLFGVFFKDSNNGWVMGKNGMLSKTSDGGSNWTLQNVTSEDIFSIRFFNPSVGIMSCGGGELYRTNDGGNNWVPAMSNVADGLISIQIKGVDAWVCGEAGTIIHSWDQGQTWTVQTPTLAVDLNMISFADGSNGWVAGIAGVMNRTTDGGNTWQSVSTGSSLDVTGLSIPDINHGWFCNLEGEIYSFDNTASLSENSDKITFQISPNPAQNQITLHAETNSTGFEVLLTDMQSRLLQTHYFEMLNDAVIDISTLPAGMYQVVVREKRSSKEHGVIRFIGN